MIPSWKTAAQSRNEKLWGNAQGNQFLDIANPVDEPVVVDELVEVKPPASLVVSMPRQAQQPLQQTPITILSKFVKIDFRGQCGAVMPKNKI